jgi:hypothetical protein
LGLFGFVFRASEKPFIFIFLVKTIAYIHLSIQQIGFVLHNRSMLIEPYCVMRISYCAVRDTVGEDLGFGGHWELFLYIG